MPQPTLRRSIAPRPRDSQASRSAAEKPMPEIARSRFAHSAGPSRRSRASSRRDRAATRDPPEAATHRDDGEACDARLAQRRRGARPRCRRSRRADWGRELDRPTSASSPRAVYSEAFDGCRRPDRRRHSRRPRRASPRAARRVWVERPTASRSRSVTGAGRLGGRSPCPRWTRRPPASSARSKRSFTTKRAPACAGELPDRARPVEGLPVRRVLGAELDDGRAGCAGGPRLLDGIAAPTRIVVGQHVQPQ